MYNTDTKLSLLHYWMFKCSIIFSIESIPDKKYKQWQRGNKRKWREEEKEGEIGIAPVIWERNAQEVTFFTPLLWLAPCSTFPVSLCKIGNITQHSSAATHLSVCLFHTHTLTYTYTHTHIPAKLGLLGRTHENCFKGPSFTTQEF